jgi:hypothetical protein
VTLVPLEVSIHADGSQHSVRVEGGTTVAQALAQAGLQLGALDRVSPPLYALASTASEMVIVRVIEEFEIEHVTVPYTQQTVRSEMLPAGTQRLLQAGRNGLEEVTYRVRLEDGQEVSRSPVRQVVVEAPVPEIVLAGAQTQTATISLAGRLAYLETGSAWVMSGSSRERTVVAITGDLDGRVFSLAPDGIWLAASRTAESGLNALWLYSTQAPGAPLALGVANVVHPVAWSTELPLAIALSTVQPSQAAPGWKANNDLRVVSIGVAGQPASPQQVLPPQVGGRYGWWGTSFVWSPQGETLAYRRPDSIGVIDGRTGRTLASFPVTPYVSPTDWVWMPGLSWSPDGRFIYSVAHGAPLGLEIPESSPAFDLVAIPIAGGASLTLRPRVGMFASPVVSPLGEAASGGEAQVAFLQALQPLESESSSYRLMVMDLDGSNARAVFPSEGEGGLEAQQVVWSPQGTHLAFVYRGDAWVVEVSTGLAQPLTASGRVTAVDWR